MEMVFAGWIGVLGASSTMIGGVGDGSGSSLLPLPPHAAQRLHTESSIVYENMFFFILISRVLNQIGVLFHFYTRDGEEACVVIGWVFLFVPP